VGAGGLLLFGFARFFAETFGAETASGIGSGGYGGTPTAPAVALRGAAHQSVALSTACDHGEIIHLPGRGDNGDVRGFPCQRDEANAILRYSREGSRIGVSFSYFLALQPLTRNRVSLRRAPDIRPYRGRFPQIAASAYIDPASVIIGDVVIGEDSSVWPRTVVRGDVHYIRIGTRTNIQDGCVLHVMKDEYPLVLGDDVTVGHSVTLHGCMIESRVLIGMGCIVLNGAVIGSNSIIAAGTLITERTVIPPGSLVMGSPGKIKRQLTAIDRDSIGRYAERYSGYREIYRDEAEGRGERIDWSGEAASDGGEARIPRG